MVGRSLTQPLFATMSDTIVVSPAGLPYLKITNDCGTEITDHVFQDCHRPSEKLIAQTARCMSVSNLNERRLKHSDEEVTNMRNKFLILTRNRAIFKQLERNQKWTLALICTVYFVCFCTVSMLSTFFYEPVCTTFPPALMVLFSVFILLWCFVHLLFLVILHHQLDQNFCLHQEFSFLGVAISYLELLNMWRMIQSLPSYV